MPITPADHQLALHNLQLPGVITDPNPYYAALQVNGPVHFDPFIASWLVCRHRDVQHLLASPHTSVRMRHTDSLARFSGAGLEEAFALLDLHVSFVDDPDHRRLRRTLAEPVQVRRVRTDLAGPIDEAVDTTLDTLAATVARGEPVDAVTALAAPIPIRVTQHLLGMHDVDIATIQRWSHAWGDIVAAPGHVPTGDRDRLLQTVAELVTYLQTLVDRAERRRASTAGPMLAALVTAIQTRVMRRDEVIANLLMLVTAGNETTANLIATTVMALADDLGLWRLLQAQPERVEAVVEELARLYAATQFTARRTTAAITLPSGIVIPADASVVLMLAAANRDPDAFPDPDRAILGRVGTQPVTFGHGPHLCFGAPLARQEVCRTLHRLVDRFASVTALPGRVWRRNGNLRGLEALPARLHPVAADRAVPGRLAGGAVRTSVDIVQASGVGAR
ncbi:cytochrome P450 [Dactylosporangium sp. NPDC005572]|uniref:cytochrome P450 n=1 Tax=Dactylosporangium sp. NPDC005572 TaxID=3156889 RepID=UPI0033BDD5B9